MFIARAKELRLRWIESLEDVENSELYQGAPAPIKFRLSELSNGHMISTQEALRDYKWLLDVLLDMDPEDNTTLYIASILQETIDLIEEVI